MVPRDLSNKANIGNIYEMLILVKRYFLYVCCLAQSAVKQKCTTACRLMSHMRRDWLFRFALIHATLVDMFVERDAQQGTARRNAARIDKLKVLKRGLLITLQSINQSINQYLCYTR